MRKLKIFTAVICFCCVLAGCTASTSDTSSKSEQYYLSDSSSSSIENSSSSQPSEEYSIAQLVGTFKYANVGWFESEEWFPTLELYEDANFILTLNLSEGMGEIYGTYYINGDLLILNVTDRSYFGFMGDDVDTIRFRILDANTLRAMTLEIRYGDSSNI